MDERIILERESLKFKVLLIFGSVIFLSAFLFNSPIEILNGLKNIVLSPSILLTDYIEVGNLGSTFINSGILMLAFTAIIKLNKYKFSGPVVAGIFTIGGFAFFGKNIFNVWGIVLGIYLYSLNQKETFEKYIVLSLFGTTLAPIISQVSFGFGFNPIIGIISGNLLGMLAGLILAPLASHFIVFHQGFNLYNVGFTAGIIGTLFMSVFRLFGLNTISASLLSSGNNHALGIYFLVMFITIVITGFYLNNKSFNGYKKLLKHSGKLTTDYIDLYGIGLSLINIGLLGLMSLLYVVLVSGDFNGPTIGAIFTLAGFGAFGKHIKNTIFVIIGVNIIALIAGFDLSMTTIIISALFGTCLAPISGKFGWQYGILAGILHLSIVLNTSMLHGGMNLYNNGFAAGIVAAIMVPLIRGFKRTKNINL